MEAKFPTVNIVLLFILLFITGCSSDVDSEPEDEVIDQFAELQQQFEGLSLDDFYQVSMKVLALRKPQLVHGSGLSEEYGLDQLKFNDYSAQYQADTKRIYQFVLEQLETYDREQLTANQAISYDVFKWYVKNVAASIEYENYYSIANEIFSTYWFMTQVPINDQYEAESFIELLYTMQATFNQLTNKLERAESQGIIEPARLLSNKVAWVEYLAAIPPKEHEIYTYFMDKVDQLNHVSSKTKNDLLVQVANILQITVIPGLQELEIQLKELMKKAPDNVGLVNLNGGLEAYSKMLKHHTSTDYSAEQIHQIGLENIDIIHQQLEVEFAKLGYPPEESLQQKFARVAVDGGMISAEDALSVYQQNIERSYELTRLAFHDLPTTPMELQNGSWGYWPAPFDGSRPAYYSAPIFAEQPYYVIPTLTIHEGVPGHHYQISMTQESDLPDFRHNMRFTVYIEGWGLYAEQLAFELGFYDDDPFGNIGRLQYEALRAARLIVDTGLHAKGWDFDETVEYYIELTGFSDEEAGRHIYRYSVNPGQATAYWLGRAEIIKLRDRTQAALGDNFNLKDFHQVIIASGPMPMQVLEQVVDNYIQSVQD